MTKAEIVGQLFQLLGGGQWDEIAKYLHPDFEFVEPESFPFGGSYRGLSGYQEIARTVFEDYFSAFNVEPIDVAEGKDHVVAFVRVRAVAKNGRPVSSTLAEVFEFADGKVRRIMPHYFDTAAVNAALAPE